ncbi:MAG TPA: nucleotide disphospho-sugar-binding domain-containing protein [Nocardioides sp.]|nr:nucleotide disphospho-sugar-binding domain-containing protein [Nocardioides sp.]
MRVDLVAPPMSGHLHPALGVAVRLAREPGLEVRVVSTPGAQAQVAASGIAGLAVLEGADDELAAIVNPPHPIGSNPVRLTRQFRAAMRLQARFQQELAALWADAPPDLAIVDFTLPAAGYAAEAVGARWWTLHASPCAIEATSGPPAYLGGLRPGTGPLGRTRDAAGRLATRGFKRTVFRATRRRLAAMGVGAVYRPDGTEAAYSPERIWALTPEAIEFPRGLPPSVRHVGPVLHTPPTTHPAPDLTPGRHHVLVTAGTHLPWHKQTLLDGAAAAAAALPDVEVHVSLGGCAPDLAVPTGVVVHEYVDYARDLARFDAVVHHGGSGVLGHTLAAGLPAVVQPVDYDQFDHATRLVAAGVAVRPRRPSGLAAAIREVLDDPSYAAAAARVAEEVRRAPAVEVIAAAVAQLPRAEPRSLPGSTGT